MECCVTVVKLVHEYLLWIKANVDVRLSIMRVALRRRYFVQLSVISSAVVLFQSNCGTAVISSYKLVSNWASWVYLGGRCPLQSLVTSDPGHFGPETELDIQFGP